VFTNNTVSIRFNKGHVGHRGDYWHRDFDEEEKKIKRSVTISFSNINEWSTRVVNPDQNQEYVKRYGYSPEESAAIDRIAKPSRLGCFYDSVNGLHRAPILADLGGKQPSPDQWRLFIRFT